MDTFKDLNSAFCESLAKLKRRGSSVASRGSNQREILFHSICITDPTALTIAPPIRKFKPTYAIAEWLWYLSRDRQVKNIGKWAEVWNQIQDSKGECESNYGEYIFNQQYGCPESLLQWEWVRKELLNDRDTRRGTITINQPYHKYRNPKDYTCTQYIHFFIRDNKLHLGVHMRSNDAVFGFCNDAWTFCMFQQLMLNDLNALGANVELGYYYHNAGSYHIYERHWKMMDLIINNYRKTHRKKYPDLKKYKLKSIITSEDIFQHALSTQDISLEKIKQHTNEVMELIYE
jgi:thymidylate synthase